MLKGQDLLKVQIDERHPRFQNAHIAVFLKAMIMDDKSGALSATGEDTKGERARLAQGSHVESAHEHSYDGEHMYSKTKPQ